MSTLLKEIPYEVEECKREYSVKGEVFISTHIITFPSYIPIEPGDEILSDGILYTIHQVVVENNLRRIKGMKVGFITHDSENSVIQKLP